jgi:hypothetical protein
MNGEPDELVLIAPLATATVFNKPERVKAPCRTARAFLVQEENTDASRQQ